MNYTSRFNSCCKCRVGVTADFTVFDGNLLPQLQGSKDHFPKLGTMLTTESYVFLTLCVVCRVGMKADFTVFDGNLLQRLQGPRESLPAVKAAFVNGRCMLGCANSAAVAEVNTT